MVRDACEAQRHVAPPGAGKHNFGSTFRMLLVNAQHVKYFLAKRQIARTARGRAGLLQHGLLDALSSESSARVQSHRESDSEGAARRPHQARIRGHKCLGRFGGAMLEAIITPIATWVLTTSTNSVLSA